MLVLSRFIKFLFKKFKGQVRRERHQATTNQKTVFPNNWKLLSVNGHFVTTLCWDSSTLKRKRKRWFYLLEKCREECTPHFKLNQSLNWSASIANDAFVLAVCEHFCQPTRKWSCTRPICLLKSEFEMHFSLAKDSVASIFHSLTVCNTLYVFFSSIQLIGTDYSTKNCECRIKDVACLGW